MGVQQVTALYPVSGGGGGGGGDVTPGALNFGSLTGSGTGYSGTDTITSITTSITLSFVTTADSGTLVLQYSKNGGAPQYATPVSVVSGDTLYFIGSNPSSGFGTAATGTIDVVNDTDSSTVLTTFSFNVT